MLDNIVTDKCMASMPIEILADAKVNNRKQIKTANNINQNNVAAPVPKANKTKTILNWLKNTTNTNDTTTANNSIKNISITSDNKEIDCSNHNRFDKKHLLQQQPENIKTNKNCTCPKDKLHEKTISQKEISSTGKHKEEESLKEYRGVQTLKHFWNKRITANRESVLKTKSNKQQFTKSISCLVNAINNTGEPPPPLEPSLCCSPPPHSETELLKVRKLRAFSLHDCSRNSPDFDEISLTDIDIQKHLEKDNFYKYKTAEQASKLRELSELSFHKKISNGIILPVGEKTERFDWLKRHDKFFIKKCIEHTHTNSNSFNTKVKASDNTATSWENIHDVIINDHKMHKQNINCLPMALGQNATEVGYTNNSSETSTPTLTATNSSHQSISRCRETTRKDSSKTLISTSSTNISRDSSTTSLAASANSHKAVVKRNSSTRKYSFKTHTRSYHVPRKMHSIKSDVSGGGAGVVVNPPNSLVAKLTQQFNEIIQKDKTLLEEIKRKNGVIMTHKGHVYKVVDTTALNRVPSPSLSSHDSKTKEVNVGGQVRTNLGASTVQRNIRKFESESRGLKPQVPLKSLQVLRKSNELVIHKTLTSAKLNSNKINTKKEIETKADAKPQTLALPKALEMVREEAKSPVERNEIKEVQKLSASPETATTEEKVSNPISENILKEDTKQKTDIKTSASSAEERVLSPSSENILKEDTKQETDIKTTVSSVEEKVSKNILVEDTKQETDIKTSASLEELFKQDEFSAVLPPKINSVIYKSVHKSKHNQQDKPKQEDISENESCEEIEDTTKFLCTEQAPVEEKATKCQEEDKNVSSSSEKKNEIILPCCQDKEKSDQTLENAITSNEDNSINILQTPFIPAVTPLSEQSESDVNTYANTKDNSTSPELSEEDDKKKCKHKYAKIYEKLRYFTPFSQTNKKQKLLSSSTNCLDMSKIETTPALTINISIAKLAENPSDLNSLLCENPKLLESGEYTPMSSSTPKKEFEPPDDVYSIMYNPEAKLLDALEQVDKKLQNLSNDNNTILESDEYGHSLEPNASFLHQTKEVTPRPAAVIQAVNVTLVNAIEGEQMIMEQKEIIQENGHEPVPPPLPPLPPKKALREDPHYEPIYLDKITEKKTEPPSYHDEEIHKTYSAEQSHTIEEDIYQTVEEVQKDLPKLLQKVSKSAAELDGYEPIENPDDLRVTANNSQQHLASTNYDGYEEYAPKIEMMQLPNTTATVVVRRVTDELPDLPKPKRILPKSPMPLRTAPKPPLARQIRVEQEPLEPPYYSAEENIYDTIKSSHCYESLQCVNNKLQNSPPLLRTKTSDSVSLSSNCYESISHYKRTHVVGHHSGASSTGSTITISSENKTNSLYEDSLNSSLHYASKRIYHINAHKPIHVNRSSTDANSVNGYGSSVGRVTDTSDEWTDFSENENADAENKPKFIIVRERSKAHKSPDWSRRVRDKRQRKSKSCIEDDDPDHFYEQLSPLTLSKRHSLLEQTRTNSLQRNENSVRVSKRGKQMSYSAHALGQQISDDSFDSDTDDYYESGRFKHAHNDSGVDIRNTKLPEPPSSSNQMYSFVKKFKNFIVNKKSPNSSKASGSQQKIYDNSSQFYAGNQYEGKTPAATTTTSSSLQVIETKELSTSEKNLILAQTTAPTQHVMETSTTPRKSKSGKSLRSRLRKSLVGFDNRQLSTLTPTRSTFYIEDPPHDETNGQLDSGFSEKNLSGELPTSSSTPSVESQKLSTLARKAKKEAKLNNSQRRRTTIGIRPHEPPPPPPPDSNSKPRRQSNTSWYAECGVFKNGTTNLVHDESHTLNSQNNSSGGSFAGGSTWYEEAGLYQTSGVSVASSSGSSGVSTSNEGGPAEEMSHSMFSNEPLYQLYSAAKLEAISRDMQDESSTDGYEEIGDRLKNGSAVESTRKSARPSALQLIEPKSGPERTLWSQIPEVINSYIIPTMTPRERALMEAKFEIITSEASYLKSLNLLRTHYMNHPVFRDQNVVSSRDRKSLFAHIVPVHECSEKLLTELESCWQDNIMLIGLSKRIYAVAEKHFHVYVGFCEHQGRMDRTLKQLREGKGLFAQNLELLESSPACCGLNLHSFLMLPMQRITRLPLLIDAVFSKCHPNDDEYENWKMCLAIMNKIVTQCNEAANKSEQAFEIERISRQLEFNPNVIRPLAIAPAGVLAPGTKPRYLVKKGELTHLVWRGDDAKLTFGKKFSKTTVFAFLFSDLLVLTKRKAEQQFAVFDYCPRNMLTITSGDALPQLPTKDLNSQTSKNLILMTLLENHERKTVELLLSCPSVSEQERWLQAMRPRESETPGEKLYEQWDCPQVIAKHIYENNEPDVLNLDVGDVVNVTRKLPDGWYKGERIRDGAIGWFPGSYTEEVNSVHVRARNLKQRHRLLTFTATYLESQKRSK